MHCALFGTLYILCTKEFPALYIWETNILRDSLMQYILLSDDWPVRSKTWEVVVSKILLYLWYSCLYCNWIVMHGMENVKSFSVSNNVEVLKNVWECVRCHCSATKWKVIFILYDIYQTKLLEFLYFLQFSIHRFIEILCCQIILMLTELHNSTFSRPTVTCTYVTITVLNVRLF